MSWKIRRITVNVRAENNPRGKQKYYPELRIPVLKRYAMAWAQKYPSIEKVTLHQLSGYPSWFPINFLLSFKTSNPIEIEKDTLFQPRLLFPSNALKSLYRRPTKAMQRYIDRSKGGVDCWIYEWELDASGDFNPWIIKKGSVVLYRRVEFPDKIRRLWNYLRCLGGL